MPNRSFIRSLGLFFASAMWLISPVVGSSETASDEYVKLELVSEQDALVPGKEICLGVRFDLQDKWHTYWVNPGDSGEAPRIEWHLPVGFHAGAIQWPYPERLVTPPFADYGYEHQVLLMASILTPLALTEGDTEKIAVRVHYLVCREVCIPGQKQLELSLPVKSHAAGSPASAVFDATRQRLPRPAPHSWKISAASIGDEFVLNLKTGKPVKVPQFFPLHEEQIENAALQDASASSSGVRLHLKKSKHLLKPMKRLQGVIVFDSGKAYLMDVPISRSLSGAHKQSTD